MMKSMGKFLLVLAIMVAMSFSVRAQNEDTNPVQFGIRGGVNLSNFGGSDIKVDNNTKLNDKTALVGYMAGLTVDYRLATNLYLQSGLDLTTKGAKYSSNIAGANISLKSTPMYLQLPVHLAVKLPLDAGCKLVLGAGGFASYGIGGKVKGEGTIGSISIKGNDSDFFTANTFKRFDYGVGINAGVEIGVLTLGAGYDLGLANIAQNSLKIGSVTISNDKNTVRTQNGYLAVGVRF